MEVGLPDDFRCPISLEVMSDPVILPSGHTFERSSIQNWIDSGHRTCPLTMLPLQRHAPLVPNHALRRLISNFAQDRASNSGNCPSGGDPGHCLCFPSDAGKLSDVLRRAKRDSAFRRRLADSGAVSVLLRHAAVYDRSELQEISLRILLHLSMDGDDACVGLAAEGAVDCLVAVLRGGGAAAALAATTITSLAMVEVNKCTIGAHPTAFPSLIEAVAHASERVRREAATALFVLCSLPENRRRAVQDRAVPALVCFASSGSERAVEVLALLAKCAEGRAEMKSQPGFLSVLTGVLKTAASLRGVEHALTILNLLCSNDEILALEAKNEGVLEICLSFLENEAGKIARNATQLALLIQNVGS